MRGVDTYLLDARFDSAQSFYRKARVVDCEEWKCLYSYDTKVMVVSNEGHIMLNEGVDDELLFSNTTLRHMVELLRQTFGFDHPWNKEEILKRACYVKMSDKGYQRMEDMLKNAKDVKKVMIEEKEG